MRIERVEKRVVGVLLSIAILMTVISLLPDNKTFAATDSDWQEYLQTKDIISFQSDWEGAGSVNNLVYRFKHVDSNTILEEIYGTGALYCVGITPNEGEKLIIDVGGDFTSVADGAFNFQYSPNPSTYLKEIIMPDSITEIGNYAFAGCKTLSSIKMPENLIRIGGYAFSGCSSLKNVNFPPKLQYIEQGAFSGCEEVKSITTPSSIKSVSSLAFWGCTGLTSVTFTGDEAIIGDCIYRCPNLRTLTVGEGVKTMAESYNESEKLETISLNTNTKYTTNSILSNKTSVAKVIFTGTGNIKYMYLDLQPRIKVVEIKNGVKAIGKDAFNGLKNVEKITVPASVKTIGSGAFSYCKHLKKLTIGAGTTKLGRYLVYGSNNLKTITLQSKKLKKNTVKGCLSESKVKQIKVKVGSDGANKTYVKKYKTIFTKKNAGQQVVVK